MKKDRLSLLDLVRNFRPGLASGSSTADQTRKKITAKAESVVERQAERHDRKETI